MPAESRGALMEANDGAAAKLRARSVLGLSAQSAL